MSLVAGSDGVMQPSAHLNVLAHGKGVNDTAVAPNDRMFATASQDRTVKVRPGHPSLARPSMSHLSTCFCAGPLPSLLWTPPCSPIALTAPREAAHLCFPPVLLLSRTHLAPTSRRLI